MRFVFFVFDIRTKLLARNRWSAQRTQVFASDRIITRVVEPGDMMAPGDGGKRHRVFFPAD
jgi:hypothetical protein